MTDKNAGPQPLAASSGQSSGNLTKKNEKTKNYNEISQLYIMKKTVFILSVLALVASSCGQSNTKKQTTNICQGDTLVKLSDTHGFLFLYYDTELELYYKPRIVDFRNNDTVIIQNFAYENGSELDVRVSPNKKYAVIDNIIKGYVAGEMYENYQCVLIDIDNAILLDTWQSACGGEWDKNNNWVNGSEIVFPLESEEPSEGEYFVTKTDWEGVECNEYQEDGGYTNIQECTFPNANLQQVYDIIKEEADDLKQKLPIANIQYKPHSEWDTVEYLYKSNNHLLITLLSEYMNSKFVIEIIENENNTIAKITRQGGN